jgi:hypothetical protein
MSVSLTIIRTRVEVIQHVFYRIASHDNDLHGVGSVPMGRAGSSGVLDDADDYLRHGCVCCGSLCHGPDALDQLRVVTGNVLQFVSLVL